MEARIIDNRFQIQGYLGRGAQGEVYRVVDLEKPELGLIVKIFSIPSDDSVIGQFFCNELRFACGLRHPGLLKLYESGIMLPEKKPYYIAEYFSAKPLQALLRNSPQVEQVYEVMFQVLTALEYLHRSGLLHLDIKPSNILVAHENKNTKVKLIDYGTLRHVQDGKVRMLGTLRYMSPHVLRGGKPREQDDLYSLGVSLYQWLHRSLPLADLPIEDYIGRVRLGVHPFLGIDFSDCKDFSKFIRDLIYGTFASAEEARQVLQKEFGVRSTPSGLCFPQPRCAKSKVEKIQSVLKNILFSHPCQKRKKRIIWIDGPKGAGKSTLIEQSVNRFAREKNMTVLTLPAIPQNSVVAAIRTVAERFAGTHVFSGLDPLATTQRLLSRSYRMHFFRLACEMIERVVQKRDGLIIIFESVSQHDFFMLEFLCELNEYFEKRPLALVIVVACDSNTSSTRNAGIENTYLLRIFQKSCAHHVSMPFWSRKKTQKFLDQIFGNSPRTLCQAVLEMPIRTPGIVRDLLEDAYRDNQLKLRGKKWIYQQDNVSVSIDLSTSKNQFLRAILPYLPQPTSEAMLEPLFAEAKELRVAFVQMVQEGIVLRDEARYFWRGEKSFRLTGKENMHRLQFFSKKEPFYLLPLCQHFPREENAVQLIELFNALDHSDRYLPFPGVLMNLIENLSGKSPSLGLLYYHLGRVQSLNGKISEARSSFTKARSCTSVQLPQRRFLILIETGNVLAKVGKHPEALRLFKEAKMLISAHDERHLAQGLEVLTAAIQQGNAAFPIPEMTRIVGSITRPDFSGRLALRYAQSLLWAECIQEAKIWIIRAVADLQSSGQQFRLARALRMQARMLRDEGSLQAALAINEQSLSILKGLFLPQEEMETLLALFYLQRRLGNEQALKEYLAQIARLIPLLPDTHYELIWPELVALTREEKYPEEALSYYRSKERLAHSCHSYEHEYVALANQVILEMSLGKPVKARQAFRRAKLVYSNHGKNFPLRLKKGHEQLLEFDA